MNVTEIPEVGYVHRQACKRQDEVDTSYPGIMQAVMNLVQDGIGQARNTVKYDSPSFAAELLLLAGMSLLSATDRNECTKSCVDYKNLVIKGRVLPTQTIFVCMQDEDTPVAAPDRSPVKNLRTETGVPDHEEHIVENVPDTANESLFQSVPIDAEAESAMEEEAEALQEARFAGKPTAASDGAKLPKKLLRGKMRVPAKQPGLTGVRD